MVKFGHDYLGRGIAFYEAKYISGWTFFCGQPDR